MSFSKYLKELRIGYAVNRLNKDLVFSNYSLKAVAAESGFANYKSFYRAFEEIVNEKPSVYIEKMKGTLES